MVTLRSYLAVLLAYAALGLAACNQSDFGQGGVPPEPNGPGDPAWGDTDVSCQGPNDCAPNETCQDHICQMPRCQDGPYVSSPPIGPAYYVYADRELLAIDDGGATVHGFAPSGGALATGASVSLGGSTLVDVAGGNLFGTRPERFAAAVVGSSVLRIQGATGVTSLDAGLDPIALAAGDVDGDGIDELVAVAADGRFAVCQATTGTCSHADLGPGRTALDVAVADVDGDRVAEAVFLVRNQSSGKTELTVWNGDAAHSDEPPTTTLTVDDHYLALAAGDLDGDGLAEVLALADGGWLDLVGDHVHIYRLGGGRDTRLGDVTVSGHSRDLTAADFDSDGKAEVSVLRDGNTVEVYRGAGAGSLTSAYSADLTGMGHPHKLAAADVDGDSPIATLIGGPELVAGAPVPTMVMNFPPYSRTYSDGLPDVFVGDVNSVTHTYNDSVALSLHADVGIGTGFPGGGLGADLMFSLGQELRQNRIVEQARSVSSRFSLTPNPELHGDHYAVVVLASGCFHSYRYRIDDPRGRLGKDGGELAVLVPVGGSATVWSSPRYDAMAKATGLPLVTPPPKLGDPSVYPGFPARADGSPVAADDLVFPDPPRFEVSDVGRTGWWMTATDRVTNESSRTTSLSVTTSIQLPGFHFGGGGGVAIGHGYGLTVGHDVLFGGSVPPLPDDPATPEDEYTAHAYAFSPVVYREHYTDAAGADAGYYVLTYAVSR